MSAIDQIREGAELAAQLDQTRTRIATLMAELEVVRRTVLPLDAALRRLRMMTDAAALPKLDLSTFMSADVGPPRTDLTWAWAQNQNGLLLALCGAEIAKAVEVQLRAAYSAGIRTMTGEARRKRIAELEAETFALEVQEEQIIRQAEAAGLELSRRGDANPAVVLAEQLEA